MSFDHKGLWHYERIPGRMGGGEWRVADEDDDVVTDFPSEEEAVAFVRRHNAALNGQPAKPKWRY